MAEEKPVPKARKSKNTLVGSQAVAIPGGQVDNIKLDIDTNKALIDNIIEAGITGGLNISTLEDFTMISNSRDQIYQLIDSMAKDSSVAAIIRTYAEDVCETADSGHIVWCEANDPKISKFINYLLNTMNVDKNIFGWVYCLIKYGDVYLRLYRESDYQDKLFNKANINKVDSVKAQLNEEVFLNLHDTSDKYSYYVEMVPDPSSMFELTRYGKTYGYIEVPSADLYNINYLQDSVFVGSQNQPVANYRMRSNDVNVYQADDFVHACLDDNYTRFPEKIELFNSDKDYRAGKNAVAYNVRRGKSLLYDSYKIWREKSLLENAALLNRITRSSVVRNIQVEVGDMPKSQVQATLRRIKELFEQKSAINVGTGFAEYNNPGPLENNIFTATHNGQGAISVNAVGGDVEVKNLADLDWWNNKFYSAYGIPKQYFGWTDDGAGFNGGASLTILSSVYAKGVKRVQNAILQAITDIINLILINKGCSAYLNKFVLKMKIPLTQEEKDYREDLSNRVSAISNIQSLLVDVEDRARKLKILKSLISTLNYGDDIIEELQKEIAAAEKEAREAREAAEEAKRVAEETSSTEESIPETPEAELPPVAITDSLNVNTTKSILDEAVELLVEDSEKLPTPEEADQQIDFTQNK